jgi:hypothetical protein
MIRKNRQQPVYINANTLAINACVVKKSSVAFIIPIPGEEQHMPLNNNDTRFQV